MGDEKDAFYVVRKGDVIGVYKNLSDLQALLRTSVCFFYLLRFKYFSAFGPKTVSFIVIVSIVLLLFFFFGLL